MKQFFIILVTHLIICNCFAEVQEFFTYGEIQRDGEFTSAEIVIVPANKNLVIKSIFIVGGPEFTRTYINPDGYVEHFDTTTTWVGSTNPQSVETVSLFEGYPQRTISYGSISFDHDLMQVYENETLKVTLSQFPYIYSQESAYYSPERCVYYIYGYWTSSFNIADINKDGIADLSDFSIFAQNWLNQ